MKIVTVVGARPQFVKAAAVSRAIAAHNAMANDPGSTIHEVIIHTGQHFDANMSDIFFEEMQIPKPDYFLDINSLNHGAMTGRMLEKIEELLLKETPDCVMIYGDTNSTLAGALAAKKLHIKVVHVEAGLRSFNMRMPEEVNRILTDRISDILCCPTNNAVKNLKNEGFDRFPCVVVNTGDVMQDAALYYSAFSASKSSIIREMDLENNAFVVCTIHRAENTDNPARLASIMEALNEIAKKVKVILPLHPRTRKILADGSIPMEFIPIDPVGYIDVLELIKHAKLVLTDSGGLQKEAYFFAKPCITLRDETEWVELVQAGANFIAGANKSDILFTYDLLENKQIDFTGDLYGGGKAASKIIKELLKCK